MFENFLLIKYLNKKLGTKDHLFLVAMRTLQIKKISHYITTKYLSRNFWGGTGVELIDDYIQKFHEVASVTGKRAAGTMHFKLLIIGET